VLSACIGLERELRHRDAGLRTQAIVGVASALFVLVSKYGFSDIIGDHVTLDPSRVAAQIVSGIGFVGAGLIFVRRNAVRGLTTAAVVWLTAAVGAAAGAGLPLLAVVVTAAHFVMIYGFSPIARRLPDTKYASRRIRIDYVEGHGTMRKVLLLCTELGFAVEELGSSDVDTGNRDGAGRHVTVVLDVRGKGALQELAAALDDVDGVRGVSTRVSVE
jgi:putative Mg2+ transporter-C (MgtC) family protein